LGVWLGMKAGFAGRLSTHMSASMLARPQEGYRHEALMYVGDGDFMDATASFIQEGTSNGEPILVVVSARKIDLLRARLGAGADQVRFADMDSVGTNPARIIPAWREFVDQHARAGPFRGIGEPIWAGRSHDELVECQRHESLLNLAFAETPEFQLLCPYDTEALAPDVIQEAHRSHPLIVEAGAQRRSSRYRGLGAIAAPFEEPLPEPPCDRVELSFHPGGLQGVRDVVRHLGERAGLGDTRLADLVVAANEVVTNALQHGGGAGRLRVWVEPHAIICEVLDSGSIDDPLVGRQHPAMDVHSGRGLWLANQLCELVQIRSSPAGTVVRLHLRRA
jgi:anti-sigma regulatory factor (Ser/Thr protein kinase)